jgi:hypothetical protein
MNKTCITCGRDHLHLKPIIYTAPSIYFDLADSVREETVLTSEICIIKDNDTARYFILSSLHIKLEGYCTALEYHVWVKVNESDFNKYRQDIDCKESFDGSIANTLIDYEVNTIDLPVTILVDNYIGIPQIKFFKSNNHQVAEHYNNGLNTDFAAYKIELLYS